MILDKAYINGAGPDECNLLRRAAVVETGPDLCIKGWLTQIMRSGQVGGSSGGHPGPFGECTHRIVVLIRALHNRSRVREGAALRFGADPRRPRRAGRTKSAGGDGTLGLCAGAPIQATVKGHGTSVPADHTHGSPRDHAPASHRPPCPQRRPPARAASGAARRPHAHARAEPGRVRADPARDAAPGRRRGRPRAPVLRVRRRSRTPPRKGRSTARSTRSVPTTRTSTAPATARTSSTTSRTRQPAGSRARSGPRCSRPV